MINIRKLIFDRRNIAHMRRHGVIPEEVVYVCQHNPFVQAGEKQNRVVVIGYTEEKRLLGIPLHNRGEGRYYPLTAYDASPEDKVLYTRERGGEKDDEEEK
jgi:uncharacterized DUF497 family protein